MPTLQAADIDRLAPATTLAPTDLQKPTEIQRARQTRLSRIRGYCALGILLIVALCGYVALFALFDRILVAGG